MQIYRGMAIGTAAPTPEEMEGIPHHMVGVADPAESWSVARFVSEADICVQDILRRGRRKNGGGKAYGGKDGEMFPQHVRTGSDRHSDFP